MTEDLGMDSPLGPRWPPLSLSLSQRPRPLHPERRAASGGAAEGAGSGGVRMREQGQQKQRAGPDDAAGRRCGQQEQQFYFFSLMDVHSDGNSRRWRRRLHCRSYYLKLSDMTDPALLYGLPMMLSFAS